VLGENVFENLLGVAMRFVRGKRRSGVVGSGTEGDAMGSMISAGTERVGEGETNEKASL